MKCLLDTHVWIWSQEDADSLGPQTQSILSESANEIAVSTISTLEIARLISLGQIHLEGSLKRWVSTSIRKLLAQSIPISHDIAIASYTLPGEFHKDPADRILVATALTEKIVLLTADERILDYPQVRSFDASK